MFPDPIPSIRVNAAVVNPENPRNKDVLVAGIVLHSYQPRVHDDLIPSRTTLGMTPG